ncbi:MAG: glycosyltransferase family 9 protein [Planctomycetes bacterium]|nr:glycosyltransferase family 9 protein [Planctomycetota bacterium]
MLRAADRLLGVPAVYGLGLLRRPRPLPSKIHSIGLLKTACIGDTVLLSAVAADIRAAYPSAVITLLAGESNAAVGPLIPAVDHSVTLPITRPFAAMGMIRLTPFDLLIDFGAWPRIDALLARRARAAFTVGFNTPGYARHYAYDRAVAHSLQRHEVVNYRALAVSIGVKTRHAPALRVPDAPVEWLPSGPFAVFHPFSGGYRAALKEWPEEHWVQLAINLAGRGWSIVLTGSLAEQIPAMELRDLIIVGAKVPGDRVIVGAGHATLAQTAWAVSRAAVVVSVNTGLMHIAAALGVPTVSLDGSVSALRWGPVGARVVSVEPSRPGGGYLSLGFEQEPEAAHDIMRAIEVERVIAAIDSLA